MEQEIPEVQSIYATLRRRPPPFPRIEVGTTRRHRPIELGYDQLQYHTQIIGLSGRGKSRAIEHLLRQFLLNRVGFTLIDPHGDIYEALLGWLTRQRSTFFDRRTIHLFDPAHPRWRFGYNPLRIADDTPAELRDVVIYDQIEAVMEAVSQVMGGEQIEGMPLYQRTFSTVLYTLAHNGLTIYEAMRLLPASEEAFRQHLAADLPDDVARTAWQEMHSWRLQEYSKNIGSLYNRLHRMMRHPFMRQIFGQTKDTLDVRRVMDEGQVVLANFQQRVGFPDANADLLARLLLCDYTQTARSRVANKSRPHFLVIDECHRYLTSDIERILVECRKFGLHLMLAHQTLAQLREAGDLVYEGVMGSAQNKLVFGSDYQSALEIADRFFAHEYDLERPKKSMMRPVQVGVERGILRGKAKSNTTSTSWNSSTATMTNAVAAHGMSFDADGNPAGETFTDAGGSNESLGSGTGGSEAHSVSYTEHEALMPIYKMLPTVLHDLSEERHIKAVEIAKLGRQEVIVRTADNQRYDGVTVSFDRYEPTFKRVQVCAEQLFVASSYNTEVAKVEEELKLRWKKLDEQLVSGADEPALIEGPEHLKKASWD